MNQQNLKNETLRTYSFLNEMYQDEYFPNPLVDKGKQILIDLCFAIESRTPADLNQLYSLTHAATNKFNDLGDEFDENGSEIETVAREIIADNFQYIVYAFGFMDADIEEVIATREW